jgi:hypothetical protein
VLTHFNMTSNFGINSTLNILLQNCLFQDDVARNFVPFYFCLPILGWFNDEHYIFQADAMYLTYICKLSCNNFMWFVSCDNSLDIYFKGHANYLCIYVSYVQQLREVQMDTSGKRVFSPGWCWVSVPVAQPGLTNRDWIPIFSPGCYTNRD